MRIALPLLALAFTGACEASGNEQEVGWHYRSPSNAHLSRMDYVFSDQNTRLVGRCDGGPTLYLMGGEYPERADRFTLTVDEKVWQLPITYHAHGRFLAIDDPGIEAAIIGAKGLITFRVGEWERKLLPSPLLQRYANDCS